MAGKIAITHPGKMGDAIYALGAIRWLCDKHQTKADFFTSSYCSPLKSLFEYQSCIDTFSVSSSYKIEHMGMGVQPWLVPVPGNYEFVYHLGFREVPPIHLPDYICTIVNAPTGLPLYYEYPDIPTLDEDYIVVAPRGEVYWRRMIRMLTYANKAVVQIGSTQDTVLNCGIDKTGLDFLETTVWIAKSKVFMGCKSSQLTLAEGFSMPRLVKGAGIGSMLNLTGSINDIVPLISPIKHFIRRQRNR